MDSHEKLWAIDIRHAKNNVVWAFPYHVPEPSYPPFPGFDVLEGYLHEHYVGYSTNRLYNNGSPVLEIKFATEQEAMMFVLRWS